MSPRPRRPAADAATTGASRRSTTIARTFGALSVNTSAAVRSRKHMNSSSGARVAMAVTISRVKRPYPRSFAQQVASIPMRTRSLEIRRPPRAPARAERAYSFTQGPGRGKPEDDRCHAEKAEQVRAAAHYSLPCPRKQKHWNSWCGNHNARHRHELLSNSPRAVMPAMSEPLPGHERQRKTGHELGTS